MHKTRKAATAAGEGKYYTGKLCSKGHDSFRYTQSGTCAECIRPSSSRSPRLSRINYMNQYTTVLIFLPPKDLQAMTLAIGMLNEVRWPGIAPDMRQISGGDAYVSKYRIRAHPEDSKLILEIAASFCRPFRRDPEAIRRDILARLHQPLPPIIPRA